MSTLLLCSVCRYTHVLSAAIHLCYLPYGDRLGRSSPRAQPAPPSPPPDASQWHNDKLQGPPDLPKVTTLDAAQAARLGGPRMLVAAPMQYDAIMSQIPQGQVTTVDRIRAHLAAADVTCPLTADIFVTIVAHASEERTDRPVPWWRTLKTDGELNPKYPGGLEAHKTRLEAEGHTVQTVGTRYVLTDLAQSLYPAEQPTPTDSP